MTDDLNHNFFGTRNVEMTVVGGEAGCPYVARRLLQTEVRVVSAYSRGIGDCLHSLQLPDTPRLTLELGGMRFLNTHERVMSLNSLVRPLATTTHSVRISKFRANDAPSDRVP